MTTTSTGSNTLAEKKSAKSLDEDFRFKIGPVRIQTFEDAVQAYLREEINEEELDAAAGKFGQAQGHWRVMPGALGRPDVGFRRDLPEKYFDDPNLTNQPNVDERLEMVEKKAEQREAATKAAEKVTAEAKPQEDLAVLQNEAARKAAEKVDGPEVVLEKLHEDNSKK